MGLPKDAMIAPALIRIPIDKELLSKDPIGKLDWPH